MTKELHLSLTLMESHKAGSHFSQPQFCQFHTDKAVTACLGSPGSCVERQAMMGVSSPAKSPFASPRAATTRPWLDRALRLNGCLS